MNPKERVDENNQDVTGSNHEESSSSSLDNQHYYYQTKTGSISKVPLSVRQLIRLLCPVREGFAPILPPNTQCLSVARENQNQAPYGEWKTASQMDILREASCANWFWTLEGSPAEGPVSCRTILQVALAQGDLENSKLMVFAQDITPEWTRISNLKHMRQILMAIQANPGGEKVQEQASLANSIENGTESNQEKETTSEREGQDIQNELEAFLSSTDGPREVYKEREDDDHMYESDGGTRYVKDPLTGNWIHEALAPKVPSKTDKKATTLSAAPALADLKKKPSSQKAKKAKFSKKNAKLWIYISGLPTKGVTEEDVKRYFSKAGMLDLDPETLQSKVKLYKNNATGELKGDASIRYARPESVELALQILDHSLWDKDHRIKVERATFSKAKGKSNGTENGNGDDINSHLKRKRPISEAQRKVARLAILQAQDDGFGGRLAGGRKGLCIIVVKKMMGGIVEDELEKILYEAFEKFGTIEKITCISKTRVVIVKYVEPIAASAAIQALNGSPNPRTNEKMEAIYWDGVTDYTTMAGDEEIEKEEEERRHEEFGNWLESQEELPPEFQLQVSND